MTIKQLISVYSQHKHTPCPLTEKLVAAGYQQTYGGYIDKAKSLGKEVDYLKNKPSQYWHLMSYCETKKENDLFTKSVVCGELIFWMAEVLDCVPKDGMNSLLSDIVGIRIPAPNGRYLYDRERWNKEIQKLCFDSITDAISQVQ